MKTTLLLLLIVLLTGTMQAQIPTLVDKNFNSIKISHTKEAKKGTDVLEKLKQETIDSLKNLTQNIQERINKEPKMLERKKKNESEKTQLENDVNYMKSKPQLNNKKFMQILTDLNIKEISEKKREEAIQEKEKEIAVIQDSIQFWDHQINKSKSESNKYKLREAEFKVKMKVIEDMSNKLATKRKSVQYATSLDMYKQYFKVKKDSIAAQVKQKKTIDISNETKITVLDSIKKEIKKLKKLNREMDRSLRFVEREEKVVLMPSLNHQFGSLFFRKFYYTNGKATNYLNSFALNYSNSGALIQSEVIADTYGPIRIGLGTLIQANSQTPDTPEEKEKEQQEDQLENLINGGGNFYLETIFPVFIYAIDEFSSYLYLNNKTAMGLKGFSDSIDTSTFNSAFGMNLYLGANTAEKKFNFFINADANYNVASKEVYENLNIKDRKGFLTAKLVAGITFDQKFRLSATFNTLGSEEALRSGKVIVGLQIIPSKNN